MNASRFWPAAVALSLALGLASTAPAQVGGGDAGPTPVGREGFMWQTEIDLAKEELAQFAADLERASLEEWKAGAAAWVEVSRAEAEQLISVPSSFHVGSLDAERAEVEVDDPYDPAPRWEIRYESKLPRELTLVLTDTDTTRVTCPLRTTLESSPRAYLGVFARGEVIECFARTSGVAG